MQELIVILIIAVAVAYVVYTYWPGRKKSSCGCAGCSGCSAGAGNKINGIDLGSEECGCCQDKDQCN